MSTKTEQGDMLAAELLDVVMLTWNLQQQDSAALARAHSLNRGVLVKKGLMSGHVQASGDTRNLVQDSMQLIFGTPGIHSMIVGTLNPAHLRDNVGKARSVLAG
jgi:aryl-alcohol dehydrogenase-like predicted oxidoreductase